MDCSPSDFLCQFFQLIADNEYLAGGLAEKVGAYWTESGGTAGVIAQFLRDFGQLLVGLIGGSFGFYRYWRYREKILHQRLIEYLSQQDLRLQSSSDELLKSIQRPGPGRIAEAPIFAPKELRRVLRERRWDVSELRKSVAESSLSDLSAATKKIENRISAAEQTLRTHREQLAAAYLFQGAITSVKAGYTSETFERKSLDNQALDYFRSALKHKRYSCRLAAHELEAHQLRKLGEYQAAEQTLFNLMSEAERINDEKTRHLLLARCNRYRAEIAQLVKLIDFGAELAPSRASARAYTLLLNSIGDEDREQCAIDLLDQHAAKLKDWEILEKADTHMLAATVSYFSNFSNVERQQLSLAKTLYNDVIQSTKRRGISFSNPHRRLISCAKAGLKRVSCAENGFYDTSWLQHSFPSSSNQPKNDTQTISPSSSYQGIAKAPN